MNSSASVLARKLRSGIEQQAADLVPHRRSAGLTDAQVIEPARGQRFAEPPNLGRLPDPFGAFEHDQLAAPRRHPSVMMELVAPLRMPSVIQLFTCSIVLSKFS